MEKANVTLQEQKIVRVLAIMGFMTWVMIRDLGIEQDIVNLEEKGIVIGTNDALFVINPFIIIE